MRGRSFSLLAEVTVESADDVEGVLFAHGGRLGGHTLFVQDGRLTYVYNFLGEEEQVVVSTENVAAGSTSSGCGSSAPASVTTGSRRSET